MITVNGCVVSMVSIDGIEEMIGTTEGDVTIVAKPVVTAVTLPEVQSISLYNYYGAKALIQPFGELDWELFHHVSNRTHSFNRPRKQSVVMAIAAD